MKKTNIFNYIYISFFVFIFFFNIVKSQNLSININLQSLDSYTPPFYEGRALYGEGSKIKAIAEINGNNTSGLFYAWYYNDFYLYKYSKINGNRIYFTLDQLQNVNTLKLEIYSDSSQSDLIAEKTVEIRPYKSLALLYNDKDNLLLTYANAINKKFTDFKVNKNDNLKIKVEPFFFSINNPNDKSLLYEWGQNGIIGNIDYSNQITYTVPNINTNNLSTSIKITNTVANKNLQEANSLVKFILAN